MADKCKPDESEVQTTTVWSFPVRGTWATHNNKYRGNFAPQIARNIIKRYSQSGEVVLDPMAGGGTTLIEARLLGRKFIGADINLTAVKLCEKAIDFSCEKPGKGKIVCADARDLSFIIKYGNKYVEGDLSAISNLNKFCDEIEKVAHEFYRVLKPGKYCAILIGDTRRRRHYVPLAFSVMQRFLKAGFILKEDVVKVQHNCSTTRYWGSQTRDFLLIMHEHLFVFRKQNAGEDLSIFKDSISNERKS
jgi:DNA modification methylase